MELESEDGEIIPIESVSVTELGRGLGLGLGPSSSDRTVSRRHLSLQFLSPTLGKEDNTDSDPDADSRVTFEMIGKNPILVCSRSGVGKRVYRKLEKGELGAGDRFSLSMKNPFFFTLKRREGAEGEVEKRVLDAVARREKRTLERRKEKEERESMEVSGDEGHEEVVVGGLGLELSSLDASQIDPIKEFGFLVKGHEFDCYPRQKIRAVKDWNWFLEEPRENSDDDDVVDEAMLKGKGGRRKKKKGGGIEDEDWMGERGDQKELVVEVGSTKRPKYSTRSKDPKKPRNDTSSVRKPVLQKAVKARKDDVDDEDETLGGFVVCEDEEEEAEEEDEEDELEEETEDEEEDDDD